MHDQAHDTAGNSPAQFSRAELATAAEVSLSTLDHWERRGLLRASIRKAELGETVPNQYSTADRAVAIAVGRARRMGLRGEILQRLADHLYADPRLEADFDGWAVLTLKGDVRVSSDLPTLTELVAATNGTAFITIRIPQASP